VRLRVRIRGKAVLDLNFDIHTSRHVQAHQHVDGLGIRIKHVDQPVVGADLKVFVRILIDESGTANCKAFHTGGQGDRADNLGATAFCCLDDPFCGLVENAMIKSF